MLLASVERACWPGRGADVQVQVDASLWENLHVRSSLPGTCCFLLIFAQPHVDGSHNFDCLWHVGMESMSCTCTCPLWITLYPVALTICCEAWSGHQNFWLPGTREHAGAVEHVVHAAVCGPPAW